MIPIGAGRSGPVSPPTRAGADAGQSPRRLIRTSARAAPPTSEQIDSQSFEERVDFPVLLNSLAELLAQSLDLELSGRECLVVGLGQWSSHLIVILAVQVGHCEITGDR